MTGILSELFRAQVSKLKDYRMKAETEFDVAYPTGYLVFDFKNGSVVHVRSEIKSFSYYSVGVADGSMIMIIGRSGCGKSTWCWQAAANIVRPFKTSCIFADVIESGMPVNRQEFLTKFGPEEFDDRVVARNIGITAENFYERIKMIHDMKNSNRDVYEYDTGKCDNRGNRIFKLEPTVYLLDSIAMLMPEKYTTEDELSGQMSATAAAKTNSSIFKRVIPMLKSANIILILINHITTSMSIDIYHKQKAQVSYLKQDEALPGGRTIIYLANNIIRMDDVEKLTAEKEFGINGSIVEFTLIKSRSNRAGQSVKMIFDQDNGFDQELSMFLFLKETGHVKGAGAYLYLEGLETVKFAQRNFKSKLHSSGELYEVFVNLVMAELDIYINKTQVENAEEAQLYSSVSDDIINRFNQSLAVA